MLNMNLSHWKCLILFINNLWLKLSNIKVKMIWTQI